MSEAKPFGISKWEIWEAYKRVKANYGRYYRSALYPPMRQLDRSLARWAYRKYKKLRRHLRRATHWVARISRRDPRLFAHWQMGVRRGSLAGAV